MKPILIIKLGAIGDVLRTTSILNGLKEKYSSKIIWITKKESYDFIKNNPLIDKAIILEDKDKVINNAEFSLVISLDDDVDACRIASEATADRIIGAYLNDKNVVNDKNVEYTDDSSEWFDIGLISRFGKARADELKKKNTLTYQEILGKMLKIEITEPMLALDEKSLAFAKSFADKNGINGKDCVIGINTGAGSRWQLKRLSIGKTVDLINMINREIRAKIILFGGPEEAKRNKGILGKSNKSVIDAGCNNSLLEFAALVNLCGLVVTSDSLAMNIAIALKKKVVAFFGPTSAAEIELYGRGKKIVPSMECVCCYNKKCDKKPNCMDSIQVKDIINAIKGCLI